MAWETLPVALKLMFGSEGGYSNSKTDSGGPTKFGITHKTLAAHRGLASVTAAQVKALTLQEATEIYERSYWSQSGGDLLPVGLDYAAFDFGVNSHPTTAVKKLQKVLGIRQDGHAGEITARAAATYPGGVQKLIRDFCDERMVYLRSLGGPQGFGPNGRGWTIRVTGKDPKKEWKDQPGVVGNAIRIAGSARQSPMVQTDSPAPVPVSAPPEAQAKADVKSTAGDRQEAGSLGTAGRPHVGRCCADGRQRSGPMGFCRRHGCSRRCWRLVFRPPRSRGQVMFSTPRIIGLLAIIAVIGAAALWIYREGGEDTRNATERQNNEAATRADEGALAYDACRNASRVWSFGTGECLRPEARGRD